MGSRLYVDSCGSLLNRTDFIPVSSAEKKIETKPSEQFADIKTRQNTLMIFIVSPYFIINIST